ncbi:MAG: hypothetical protein ACHQZS_11240, partial [Candidatus Binatales bacterium]
MERQQAGGAQTGVAADFALGVGVERESVMAVCGGQQLRKQNQAGSKDGCGAPQFACQSLAVLPQIIAEPECITGSRLCPAASVPQA